MDAETFDATEAAARLGLTPRTVLAMARRREIGHVRVGRFIRFTDRQVADYIAIRSVGVGLARTPRSQAAHRRAAAKSSGAR